MSPSIREICEERQVLVICGTGGVGKTTTAAALGLSAALSGRRTLVMTIDPARRLAQALGIDGKLNQATEVDLKALVRSSEGPTNPEGSLHALMLDPKSTWDGLVHRFAKDEKSRQRILSNRYYQRASASLAGSQEYMAMERLLAVYESNSYDCVILDTPPTRNALDFLDAPTRMMAMLESGVAKWLRPIEGGFSSSRAASFLFDRGKRTLFGVFERFIGAEVFSGMAEFVDAMSELLDGMGKRADRVATLLEGNRTGFFLVATPQGTGFKEALYFQQRLKQEGIELAGLVLNRVHPMPPEEFLAPLKDEAPRELLTAGPQPAWSEAVQSLWAAAKRAEELARKDEEKGRVFAQSLGSSLPIAKLPELEKPAHQLQGLAALLPYL